MRRACAMSKRHVRRSGDGPGAIPPAERECLLDRSIRGWEEIGPECRDLHCHTGVVTADAAAQERDAMRGLTPGIEALVELLTGHRLVERWAGLQRGHAKRLVHLPVLQQPQVGCERRFRTSRRERRLWLPRREKRYEQSCQQQDARTRQQQRERPNAAPMRSGLDTCRSQERLLGLSRDGSKLRLPRER